MSLEDSINNLAEALRYYADAVLRTQVAFTSVGGATQPQNIPVSEEKPAAKTRTRRTAAEIEADRIASLPAVSVGELEKAEEVQLPIEAESNTAIAAEIAKIEDDSAPLTLAVMHKIIIPLFKNPAFGREYFKKLYASFGLTCMPSTDEPAGIWAKLKAQIEKDMAS